MPRRKPIDKYPESYFSTFIAGAKREHRVRCLTPAIAKRLRSNLYACRSVLRSTSDHAYFRIRDAANECSLRIDGSDLICEPQSTIGDAELRSALEAQS